MKYFNLTSLVIVFALMMASCSPKVTSPDSDEEIDMTISWYLNGVHMTDYADGYYISGAGCTYVSGWSSPDYIYIQFPGNSVGFWSITNSGGMATVDYNTATNTYSGFGGSGDFFLYVTNYGPEGGRIKGIFSGHLDDGAGNMVVVSNGVFDVPHSTDF